jgi:hypothetical protein
MKALPAEVPCCGGPGLRCASPLKASHVASVETVLVEPAEMVSFTSKMTEGRLCIACGRQWGLNKPHTPCAKQRTWMASTCVPGTDR